MFVPVRGGTELGTDKALQVKEMMNSVFYLFLTRLFFSAFPLPSLHK
jgi:hypothetical protein